MLSIIINNFSIECSWSCITFGTMTFYTNPISFSCWMGSFFAVNVPSAIHNLGFASFAHDKLRSVKKGI